MKKAMDEYKSKLISILEILSSEYSLKNTFRSALQRDIKTNAKRICKLFVKITEMKALRWQMIQFLREEKLRDFSSCKRITAAINRKKASIALLEDEQKFKKKLLKRLG